MIRGPQRGFSLQDFGRELRKLKEIVHSIKMELDDKSQEIKEIVNQDMEKLSEDLKESIKTLEQKLNSLNAKYEKTVEVDFKSITNSLTVLNERNDLLEKENVEFRDKITNLEGKIQPLLGLRELISDLSNSQQRVLEQVEQRMGIQIEEKKSIKDIFSDFLVSIDGKPGSEALRMLKNSSLSAILVENGYSAVKAKTLKNKLANMFMSSDRIDAETINKIKDYL
ncbi:MAG: hypothetical protein ACXAEU_14895 [Candidatus Hodarchaeales archaeon]|jgi:hypothetical protein